MSKPDPLKTAKEPIACEPLEPGDLVHHLQYQRPSSDFPYERKFIKVHGVKMAYVDEGKGDPILFMHGAPESAYIWRNIMPFLQPYGRVIAIEHIGHGMSDKPDVAYEFKDYVKFTDGFIEALNLTNMTLVIHDWGTVIGLYYASRFPEKVQGIAMMEALCAPYEEALKRKGKAGVIRHYQLYKSDAGYDLAMKQNMFVEQVMMLHTARKLSQREMDAYREPFRKEEYRKPLFMWAREVPLEGDRPFCEEAMVKFNKWMLETDIPILEVYGKPGEVSEEYDIMWRAQRMKNHETAFVGYVLHFVQEDAPEATGRAIADWYRRNLAKDRNVWYTDAKP